MKRVVIQLAVTSGYPAGTGQPCDDQPPLLVALRNDGTMWHRDLDDAGLGWVQIRPVPQRKVGRYEAAGDEP